MPLTANAAGTPYFAQGGNFSSANVTVPSGTAAGDLLIGFVYMSQDATSVTGFTVSGTGWDVTYFAKTSSPNNGPAACFTKVQQSGDPTTYTVTRSGSGSQSMLIHLVAVRGFDPADPILDGPTILNESGPATAITAPGRTIPAGLPDQAMLITCHLSQWWTGAGSNFANLWTPGTGTGLIELIDMSGEWSRGATYYKLVSSDTDPLDAIANGSQAGNAGRGISIAIRPMATDQEILLSGAIAIPGGTIAGPVTVDKQREYDAPISINSATPQALSLAHATDLVDAPGVSVTPQPINVQLGTVVEALPTFVFLNEVTTESGKKVLDLADTPSVTVSVIPIETEIVDPNTYIDLDVVSGTVTPQDVTADKVVDLDTIDASTTIELPELTVDKLADLNIPNVNVTLNALEIIQTAYGIDFVEVTVTPLSIVLEKEVLLDSIDISVSSPELALEKEIQLTDTPEIVVTASPDVTASGPLILTNQTITVESPDLTVEKVIDLDSIDITTTVFEIDFARGETLDTVIVDVSIASELELPLVQSKLVAYPINIGLYGLDNAKVVNLDPIELDAPSINAVDVAYGINLDTPNVVVLTPAAITYTSNMRPISIDIDLPAVTVGFGADKTAAQVPDRVQIISQPTRVIAQSILSKRFLHWDLEVDNLSLQKTLSGPQLITGEFPVEIRDYRDLGLEPWATWIHVEEDGEIRGSGILQPASVDTGERLSLEAVGVSAYPAGMPFLAELTAIQVDPADIVRTIWEHLQSYPDGNLGVIVRGSTPVRIGEALVEAPAEGEDTRTDEEKARKPYYLNWWEAPDCGQEIDTIAKETPFDYVEYEQWNADKTDVIHYIDIGYPRIGTRRFDLRFAEEENLVAAIGPGEVDDYYASQVVLMGSGEGRDTIRGYAAKPIGSRVRRVAILDDKTVNNSSRANALSADELLRRQALRDITEVEIDARHLNARLGSFQVGDDIPVIANVPWIGDVRQWERVLSYTYSPNAETIRVSLRRSESFVYGSETQA